MARTNDGLRWQCAQFLHASPHLFWRALKKAATAERHQAVGCEYETAFCKMKRDMANGVA